MRQRLNYKEQIILFGLLTVLANAYNVFLWHGAWTVLHVYDSHADSLPHYIFVKTALVIFHIGNILNLIFGWITPLLIIAIALYLDVVFHCYSWFEDRPFADYPKLIFGCAQLPIFLALAILVRRLLPWQLSPKWKTRK